jgi:hypothetical protein
MNTDAKQSPAGLAKKARQQKLLHLNCDAGIALGRSAIRIILMTI